MPDPRPLRAASGLIAACEQVAAGKLDHRAPAPGTGDEFDELAHGFNRMLDWLCAVLATTRDANNAIAHHMRAPLASLRVDMSTLATDIDLPDRVRERISRQIERVDGLIGMFDRVLLIAKAESSVGTDLFETFDLRAAVRDVVALYEPLMEEKGLRVRCLVPPDCVRFTGDRQLIVEALANLLENARKHARDGDAVEVALDIGRGEAVLAVSDHGQGIPPYLMEKVKERFVTGAGHANGFGLGLSLVNAVTALHNGSLELADNAPGLKAVMRLRA